MTIPLMIVLVSAATWVASIIYIIRNSNVPKEDIEKVTLNGTAYFIANFDELSAADRLAFRALIYGSRIMIAALVVHWIQKFIL